MATNLLNQATPLAIIGADGAVTSPGTAADTGTTTNLLNQAKPVVIVGADGKIHTLDGGTSSSAPAYTLPAATASALGGVKQLVAIADLAEDADAATIVTTVNNLLAGLRTAGILATK
ncbi:MAG: head fiber protein [Bifidobacteriaceae bacterium]|nr:head fiber protein [Bifidobacteriaceae bacterium]